VKLETSLLAERRRRETKDGEIIEMFDELVMDEEYDVLLRRYFREGHAEVITRISSNYLIDTPTDIGPLLREFPDFSRDRDFALWLRMHDDFPKQYKLSIQVKIEQFLIDFTCFRWLETKSPEDAATYQSRLEPLIDDMQSLLIRKRCPLRRLPSFP
jgi:hypothetical protein